MLGGGIIGCEFASIFSRFGSEVTIVEMLDTLIPQEDADAAKELAKQFGKRGIALQLGKQCTKVEDDGSQLTVHYGDGETVQADLMLVSVGRGPLVEGLGLEAAGVYFDRRTGIAADEHRRTTVPHIYAVGDCAGYWQLAHTAFREGEIAAENATAATRRSSTTAPCRGRSTPTRRSPPSASPRRRRASSTATTSRSASSRGSRTRVPSCRTRPSAGSSRSTRRRYGELLGLVMVGPHVTDMIEAGVVAIDAESTVETVADGMAPHPTLSEAIKEAGLVALGRAIHVPNRKPKAKATA